MLDKIKNFFAKNNSGKEPLDYYNELRPNEAQGNFCNAPLNSLYFTVEGKVLACCFNQDFVIGTYPEQSILEIWKSDKAEELRAAMKANDLSKGCDVCHQDFVHKRYEAINSLLFDQFGIGTMPRNMEFQLSNTCNLQCIMCNGHLSSSIRKHRDQLPAIPEKYDADFVKQLEAFIPHLEYTTFSGGEPFLINLYFSMWEKFIELNPKCKLKVITNGTVFNSRIANLLSRGNFDITISLDSPIKETYEKIRIGASFDKVIANIQKFNEHCKLNGNTFNLNFCPMNENWKEIPEFVRLANRLDSSIYYSIVYYPLKHTLSMLNSQELVAVVDHLNQQLDGFEENKNLKATRLLIKKIEKWSTNTSNQQAELHFNSQEEFVEAALGKILSFYGQKNQVLSEKLLSKIKKVFVDIHYDKIYLDEFMKNLDNLPDLEKFELLINTVNEEILVDNYNRFSK